MFSSTKVALALAFALIVATPARADEVYTFILKKQETKSNYKGWLVDWLEKRDQIRLMDLWLALHSPSPYEFFVGGSYVGSEADPGGATSGTDLHAGAFASIFGLELHRDSSFGTRYTSTFDFRVFGFQDQGTNITLQGGVRSLEIGDATSRNAVFGLRTNLYFARFFGLSGLYQNFYLSTPNSSGTRVSGHRLEGGAFIDFSFLRVFGTYFAEPQTAESASGPVSIERSGFTLGARLYF